MAIPVSKDYWFAHVKMETPNPVKAEAEGRKVITKVHRDTAYRVLDELGICGKGKKYRYLSDRKFKSEVAAEKFYAPLKAKHQILAEMLQINRGFDLIF